MSKKLLNEIKNQINILNNIKVGDTISGWKHGIGSYKDVVKKISYTDSGALYTIGENTVVDSSSLYLLPHIIVENALKQAYSDLLKQNDQINDIKLFEDDECNFYSKKGVEIVRKKLPSIIENLDIVLSILSADFLNGTELQKEISENISNKFYSTWRNKYDIHLIEYNEFDKETLEVNDLFVKNRSILDKFNRKIKNDKSRE